jgi:outer membrane protein OmpA-like peptidoglycan-associated protein
VKYYKIIISFSLLFSSLNGIAQDCNVLDKKTLKQLHKIKIEPDLDKKLALLHKAISKNTTQAALDYEIAETYLRQGNISLRSKGSPSEGEQLIKKAAYYYQTSIQKCDSYHPKSYYNLGNIFFSMGKEKEALFCYKSFVNFEEKYPDQIKGDYQNQKNNALTIIDGLEFEDKLRANPVPFKPEMVKKVSTPLDEYFPMISPDNDLLFYSRKVDRTRLGDIASNVVEEFTISEKQGENNTFSQGSPLETPFNDGTFKNYGSATLSVDNREMIICACKKERVYRQNYLNCDLYVSKFKRTGAGGNDFQWSPLKNLGPNINTKDGWEAQPSLSSDGQTLFFTSIRKGSRDNDIYISKKQNDGTWGPARPFDEINTAGKDKSPFFHQDGETLYFVSSTSDARRGMGGLDIFYVRRDGKSWTTPQNIGFPINSPEDELGIFVSTSGRIAYFSSYKDGNWNIYAFNLYKEARPEEVVIIKGNLSASDGSTVKGAKISVHYDDTDKTQEINVNEDDGSYAAVVKIKDSKTISIVAEKENATFAISKINLEPLQALSKEPLKTPEIKNAPQVKPNEENKSIPDSINTTETIASNNVGNSDIQDEQTEDLDSLKDYTVQKVVIQSIPKTAQSVAELEASVPSYDSKAIEVDTMIIDPVESGSTFELKDLLFQTDSYTLLSASEKTLDLFSKYLIKNKTYKIHIEGHTDDIGDARANLILSQKRAQEVKRYLIGKNIAAERLSAKGFGETQPKVPNSSIENRKINRRTECRISMD